MNTMLNTSHSILIRRNIEDVYRFVALDFFDNYPKWSPELLELEQLTSGPMRVGVNGRQVRCDDGYRYAAQFRVTGMLPQRELSFTSTSKPHFEVCYRFAPELASTRLTFAFRLQPTLVMLPFQNRIRGIIAQGGERVVANLRALLESGADESISGAPPGTAHG